MTAESTSNAVLDAVLNYARRGLCVLPLVPREKRPLLDDWPNACSTDEAEIHRWFDRWPDANVGIATGKKSGITVLDFDGPNAVKLFLDWCETHLGGEPNTPCVETGGGGRHYYFKYSPRIGTKAKTIFVGWDIRNDGGQAAAPPSVHPNGTEYKWLRSFDDCEPIEIPEELLREYEKVAKKARSDVRAKQGRIPTGQQEDTLTRIAGAMLRQGCSLDEIENAMLDIATNRCDPPMPEKHALRIARSIGTRAPGDPLETLEWSDIELSSRFAVVAQDRAAYVEEKKSYAAYDGRKWGMDADLAVVPLYSEMIAAMEAIHAQLPEDTDDERQYKNEFRAYINTAKKLDKRNSVIQGARHLLRRKLKDFDANPWLFNVGNGTLDLRAVTLLPHDPAQLISKISDVHYNPNAGSQHWLDFLDFVTRGDKALQRYVQKLVGCTMCGDNGEQALIIVYGKGGTGKSTFISIVRHVLGSYSAVASAGSLAIRRNEGGPRPDLAKLPGARMWSGVEINPTQTLDEALLKSISGNESISTRDLYGKEFDFLPQSTTWLIANEFPKVGSDDAIFRRIKPVPFEHQIPEGQRDRDFVDRMKNSQEDMEGVLAWAVEGVRLWQEEGLQDEPEVVKDLRRVYRSSMNPVERFIDEECVRGDDETFISLAALWDHWKTWADMNGEDLGRTTTKFKMKLKDLNFELKKRGPRGEQKESVVGLKLKPKSAVLQNRMPFESMIEENVAAD